MENNHVGDLIALRLSRREAIGGLAALLVTTTLAHGRAVPTPRLGFKSLASKISAEDAVADGYVRDVLIRWGDPVLSGAPTFDILAQTRQAQEKQFGYNNDYLGYFPLPRGSKNSEHGLLWVNHEYVSRELMSPTAEIWKDIPKRIGIEKAAMGGAVIEIRRENGVWKTVDGSPYARRITVETPMAISGPASGHARMRTKADPSGMRVLGMIGNCAGGRTPWGTVLTCEENFQLYFASPGIPELTAEQKRNAKRYRINDSSGWAAADERFDMRFEPNEPNRFGWVVEIDPHDPARVPVKRTALGRFAHEGANVSVAPDGRAVVYLGDDSVNEYIYRFVSSGKVDMKNPAANARLLDDGVLSVARFDEKTLEWLPLVFGQGPLTAANDFHSQADVLIETRRAADLVGATKMDRPEDIEASPITGHVYVMLTGNRTRTEDRVDAANPRAESEAGHILELIPPRGASGKPDHAARKFAWNIFLLAGTAEEGATAQPHAFMAMPDNCAFDPAGRLWIATDKTAKRQTDSGLPDGIYACETNGPERAQLRLLYAAPIGAEVCGPEFTPDGTTLFLAIQHPGEDSSFEKPSTRWPDFDEAMPPRPSVIAIRRRDNGPIGG